MLKKYILCLFTLVIFTSCSNDSLPQKIEPIKIGAIFTNSGNYSMKPQYEKATEFTKRALNVNFDFLYADSGPEYISAVKHMATTPKDIIFVEAYGRFEEISEIAENNPKIFFIAFGDRDYNSVNMRVVRFNFNQIAYISGYTAALRSKTNCVSIVCPKNNPELFEYFSLGVKKYSSDTQVHYVSMDDVKIRDKSPIDLISEKECDVVFLPASVFQQTLVEEAYSKSISVIAFTYSDIYDYGNLIMTFKPRTEILAISIISRVILGGANKSSMNFGIDDGIFIHNFKGKEWNDVSINSVENIITEVLKKRMR